MPVPAPLLPFSRLFLKETPNEKDGKEAAVEKKPKLDETQVQKLSPFALQARQHTLTIMAKHTFQEAQKEQLICEIFDEDSQRRMLKGVALRITKSKYATYPRDEPDLMPWISGLCLLNVGAAITLTNTITEGIVDMIYPGALEVAINASTHIQVLQTVSEIAHARKAQGAAFVLADKCVVIWTDEPEDLLSEARNVHHKLTQFLWAVATSSNDANDNFMNLKPLWTIDTPHLSQRGELLASLPTTPGEEVIDYISECGQSRVSRTSSTGQLVLSSSVEKNDDDDDDLEASTMEGGYEERPTVLVSSFVHGAACALALVLAVLQARTALVWSLLDGEWSRMAVVIVIPFYFFLVMFFCDNIMNDLLMLIGPVRQLQQNSRYFSAIKPKPLKGVRLPHITIQCPVYKEDFAFVLKPTFESIKKAIKTYELQGGSASIIVSEDGMVLLDPVERAARLDYYDENNITWIGRPKHGKDGFIREGRFKKASNLNFTYEVLLKTASLVEQKKDLETGLFPDDQTEQEVYADSLQEVLASIHPDACGSGVDRFGEYILMIDSDTRIPEDSFLDAASEMTRSKDVGILQHCSGVMIVSSSFFERCIGFFTRLVNFSISYSIANGDVAPFMGHNAYLRWSAMQEIARQVTLPNGRQQLKIWSDEHVSEDFVMALDMLQRGYVVRWATYSKSEYMEGVSLTCDDELNRWQKYAWGVSEMVLHPIRKWHHGPITPLYRRFLFGNVPIHYKWASTSYCLSYYAIAAAFPASAIVTLAQGWLGTDIQAPFMSSFEVFVAVIVVYLGLGTVSLCVVRFRAGVGAFFPLLLQNFMYSPFMLCFFGGLSYHVSTALLSHILSINMTWGATLKDIELTNFFNEAPLIFKRHYKVFLASIIMLGGLAVMDTNFVPLEWRLNGFFVLFPALLLYSFHILFPIVLNPNLIRFSF